MLSAIVHVPVHLSISQPAACACCSHVMPLHLLSIAHCADLLSLCLRAFSTATEGECPHHTPRLPRELAWPLTMNLLVFGPVSSDKQCL